MSMLAAVQCQGEFHPAFGSVGLEGGPTMGYEKFVMDADYCLPRCMSGCAACPPRRQRARTLDAPCSGGGGTGQAFFRSRPYARELRDCFLGKVRSPTTIPSSNGATRG